MAFMINDKIDIEELNNQLKGKSFVYQVPSTKHIRERKIDFLYIEYVLMQNGKLKQNFFKAKIKVQCDRGKSYNYSDIWIESKTPYRDFGDDGVLIGGAVPMRNIPVIEDIKFNNEREN